MRRNHNNHQLEDDFPMEVKKMQIWKKLFYAIFICILAYSINSGDPKKNSIAKHFQITDEKIEYIFETTIAIETKTIKQRISEQKNGVWKYINGYILGQNWADIEVKLKTRIGIKLNSITYDRLTNNVHINFGDPCILDRTLKTKIIQTSDNFFKWSIQSYQKHKQLFEEEIIQRESKQIIKYFQSNNEKMKQLQSQYYGKIMRALQYDTSQLSVQFNIVKLNQFVLSYVGKVIPQFYISTFKKAYQYEKLIKPFLAIQNKEATHSNISNTNLLSIGVLKEQAILQKQIQILNNTMQKVEQEQLASNGSEEEQIVETLKPVQLKRRPIKQSKQKVENKMSRIQQARKKTRDRIFNNLG